MLFLSLKDDTADTVGNFHADHGEQRFGAPSHAFTVEPLGRQNGRDQFILLFLAREIAALLGEHIVHEFFHDGIYGDDFLFRDAGKVVVERTAVDDVFRRFADIRRFVHECGRIARARADAPCGGCPID